MRGNYLSSYPPGKSRIVPPSPASLSSRDTFSPDATRLPDVQNGGAECGGWASGGRLLPPVADRGDEEARMDSNSRPLFPFRRPSRPRGPFSFFSSPCFLPPFLPRCRPVSSVNIASHVVSEGFCESADDCRWVICRFLAWRQPHHERKRAGSDGYGTNEEEEERERERDVE